jgi:hypothetical protein
MANTVNISVSHPVIWEVLAVVHHGGDGADAALTGIDVHRVAVIVVGASGQARRLGLPFAGVTVTTAVLALTPVIAGEEALVEAECGNLLGSLALLQGMRRQEASRSIPAIAHEFGGVVDRDKPLCTEKVGLEGVALDVRGGTMMFPEDLLFAFAAPESSRWEVLASMQRWI